MEMEYCPKNDSYAILGVPKDCEGKDIKKAYILLSRKFHPDKWPVHARHEAHDPFVRIQNAYDILSDVSSRRNYDKEKRNYFKEEYNENGTSTSTFQHWWLIQDGKVRKEEAQRLLDLENLLTLRKTQDEQHKKENQATKDKQHNKSQSYNGGTSHGDGDGKSSSGRQQNHAERLATLRHDKFSVDRDFQRWQERQTIKRQAKVQQREKDVSTMHQKHVEAQAALEKQQQRELDALVKTQQRRRDALQREQEKNLAKLRERHEAQRTNQRAGRKRLRQEFEVWNAKVEQDMQRMEQGLPPFHHAGKGLAKPDFFGEMPMYGRKKNGQVCGQCALKGGFCYHHQYQKP